MKKKTKNLVLLFILLAVLAVVYVLVVFISDTNEKKKEEESEKESIENTVKILPVNDINDIQYEKDGNLLEFKYTDGEWKYTPDDGFVVNQTRAEAFKNAILNLTAVRTLEKMDSLDAYGLENPLYSVTVYDTDGSEAVLQIGEQTGSYYYAKIKDDSQVYTISRDLLVYLDYELMDYVADITAPDLSADNVSYIRIDNGSILELKKENDEWSYNEGDGYKTVTNSAAITDVIETIKGFTGGECQNYNCKAEEKSQYGLDIPYYDVLVNYTDADGNMQTYRLYVGNMLESGDNYYYNNSLSNMVGLVESSHVDALAESYTLQYVDE